MSQKKPRTRSVTRDDVEEEKPDAKKARTTEFASFTCHDHSSTVHSAGSTEGSSSVMMNRIKVTLIPTLSSTAPGETVSPSTPPQSSARSPEISGRRNLLLPDTGDDLQPSKIFTSVKEFTRAPPALKKGATLVLRLKAVHNAEKTVTLVWQDSDGDVSRATVFQSAGSIFKEGFETNQLYSVKNFVYTIPNPQYDGNAKHKLLTNTRTSILRACDNGYPPVDPKNKPIELLPDEDDDTFQCIRGVVVRKEEPSNAVFASTRQRLWVVDALVSPAAVEVSLYGDHASFASAAEPGDIIQIANVKKSSIRCCILSSSSCTWIDRIPSRNASETENRIAQNVRCENAKFMSSITPVTDGWSASVICKV